MLEFKSFGKLGRLNRDCTITEKIDGTNAQLVFDANGIMLVGSRTREIFPEGTPDKQKGCDNQGFAKWAYENHELLFKYLGEGRHYGEWCGAGIQRNYGLVGKKLMLFNTSRHTDIPEELQAIGLGVVSVLYEGPFTTEIVSETLQKLVANGSSLNGFNSPEGIVVYHQGAGVYFKVTVEHDLSGKGKDNQSPS